MITTFVNFEDAIEAQINELKNHWSEVDAGRWQGVSTEGHPDLVTREVLDVAFRVSMDRPVPPSAPDWVNPHDTKHALNVLRVEIEPNLPWADDHFEERVSRVPSNPGEQYKNWPWAGAVEKALEFKEPDVDPRDWVYLAALIDGEGSIGFKDNSGTARKTAVSGKYRICIGQKDGDYLRTIASRFLGLGNIRTRRSPSKFGNYMTEWTISRKQDLLWCLPKLIPHLVLKRNKAESALEWTLAKGYHAGEKQPEVEPKFSHTYQERFWSRRGSGIRYAPGTLDDVVNMLLKDPYTRQAYFPIFDREDTGAVHGGRIPCTLGYHFLLRGDQLHLWYDIRSCDAVRHFRDDVYLAARLALWVIEECGRKATNLLTPSAPDRDYLSPWLAVRPGVMTFHCHSFHVHRGDVHLL